MFGMAYVISAFLCPFTRVTSIAEALHEPLASAAVALAAALKRLGLTDGSRTAKQLGHAEILLMLELCYFNVSLDGLTILTSVKPCHCCAGTRKGDPIGGVASLVGALARLTGCVPAFRGQTEGGAWYRIDFQTVQGDLKRKRRPWDTDKFITAQYDGVIERSQEAGERGKGVPDGESDSE